MQEQNSWFIKVGALIYEDKHNAKKVNDILDTRTHTNLNGLTRVFNIQSLDFDLMCVCLCELFLTYTHESHTHTCVYVYVCGKE